MKRISVPLLGVVILLTGLLSRPRRRLCSQWDAVVLLILH
jgi:hypothetical protein